MVRFYLKKVRRVSLYVVIMAYHGFLGLHLDIGDTTVVMDGLFRTEKHARRYRKPGGLWC